MTPESAGLGTRAAEMLLARREELSLAVSDAVYAARPELRDRYGEIGVAKCREDMRYTIEHLAPAIALGEPQLFGRYVAWLIDVLRARSIPEDDVRISLAALKKVLGERLPPDEYREAERSIAAALARCFGHSGDGA